MRVHLVCAAVLALPALVLSQSAQSAIAPRAKALHDRAIVVDSHDDTTQRLLFDKNFDIAKRNTNGNIATRGRRGAGLAAVSLWIGVRGAVPGPPAAKRALDLIDCVREAVRLHPNDFVLATTAADVRKAAADHKIAALMGMEGGHM